MYVLVPIAMETEEQLVRLLTVLLTSCRSVQLSVPQLWAWPECSASVVGVARVLCVCVCAELSMHDHRT